MAGNYPDAPSWRMAYDRDGSIVVHMESGVVTQLSEANARALNDESISTFNMGLVSENATIGVAIIFPELRDVDAFYAAAKVSNISGNNPSVDVSADTTNGIDGTWTQAASSFMLANTSGGVTPVPAFRTGVVSATALGVRGIRATLRPGSTITAEMLSFHVYGERSPGQALNALELWHPTNDEKLPPAWLDWGNTPRGSSEDRTFRVKNVSTTSTAEDVRVAMDVLTDGAPSVPGQHLLSYDGGSFLAQVNVGDLAPGAISGPVTLRRVTASNAQLGLFAFRVFAEPDAWS